MPWLLRLHHPPPHWNVLIMFHSLQLVVLDWEYPQVVVGPEGKEEVEVVVMGGKAGGVCISIV